MKKADYMGLFTIWCNVCNSQQKQVKPHHLDCAEIFVVKTEPCSTESTKYSHQPPSH